MVDTVAMGVGGVGIPGAVVLRDLGWDYHTWDSADGSKFQSWATTERAGVRFKYQAGLDWLSAEASLPKLLRGVNDVLLPWDECLAALEVMRGVASDVVGVELPALGDWSLSRVDPVWAWAVDPLPYLSAVRLARVPRCRTVDYQGSGLAWETMKGKRTRVRVYDKRRESRRDVDLPLRVEAQVRPKRQTVRVDGVRVDAHLGAWEARTALGIVEGMVHTLGLDRPVLTQRAARRALVGVYGDRRGVNTYRAMLDALDAGGWDLIGQSPDTVNRHLRRLRRAGVSAVSPAGELPGLEIAA